MKGRASLVNLRRQGRCLAAVAFVAAVTMSVTTVSSANAIRGGEPVDEGVFPFVVEVQHLDQSTGTWSPYCTASLIDPRAVITAAHCVPGVVPGTQTDLRLVFGRDSIHDPIRQVVGQEGIQSIVLNKRGVGAPNGDVAVVVLDEPITGIHPITVAHLRDRLPVGNPIIAAGWGMTDDNAPTEHLRSAQIPVVACPSFLSGLLCAGNQDKGLNNGDSGGPGFVADTHDGFVQYGVASLVTSGLVWVSAYTDLTNPDTWDSMRDELEAAGAGHIIPSARGTANS